MRQDGLSLEHASRRLRSDRALGFIACRQNGLALEYVLGLQMDGEEQEEEGETAHRFRRSSEADSGAESSDDNDEDQLDQ